MWKLAIITCLAIALAGEAAFAFDGRGRRPGNGNQSAQGEYHAPFVAPRVPRYRSKPGWGGRNRAREGACQAASAQFETGFEAPTYTGSPFGTILNGQDTFYQPEPGSETFLVYEYAGNSLGLPQNPGGGDQFAAEVFSVPVTSGPICVSINSAQLILALQDTNNMRGAGIVGDDVGALPTTRRRHHIPAKKGQNHTG